MQLKETIVLQIHIYFCGQVEPVTLNINKEHKVALTEGVQEWTENRRDFLCIDGVAINLQEVSAIVWDEVKHYE